MATIQKNPKQEGGPKHACLCGGRAVRKLRGDWACARCLKIEEYYYGKRGHTNRGSCPQDNGGLSEHRVIL